jgi:hypothetical protein
MRGELTDVIFLVVAKAVDTYKLTMLKFPVHVEKYYPHTNQLCVTSQKALTFHNCAVTTRALTVL